MERVQEELSCVGSVVASIAAGNSAHFSGFDGAPTAAEGAELLELLVQLFESDTNDDRIIALLEHSDPPVIDTLTDTVTRCHVPSLSDRALTVLVRVCALALPANRGTVASLLAITSLVKRLVDTATAGGAAAGALEGLHFFVASLDAPLSKQQLVELLRLHLRHVGTDGPVCPFVASIVFLAATKRPALLDPDVLALCAGALVHSPEHVAAILAQLMEFALLFVDGAAAALGDALPVIAHEYRLAPLCPTLFLALFDADRSLPAVFCHGGPRALIADGRIDLAATFIVEAPSDAWAVHYGVAPDLLEAMVAAAVTERSTIAAEATATLIAQSAAVRGHVGRIPWVSWATLRPVLLAAIPAVADRGLPLLSDGGVVLNSATAARAVLPASIPLDALWSDPEVLEFAVAELLCAGPAARLPAEAVPECTPPQLLHLTTALLVFATQAAATPPAPQHTAWVNGTVEAIGDDNWTDPAAGAEISRTSPRASPAARADSITTGAQESHREIIRQLSEPREETPQWRAAAATPADSLSSAEAPRAQPRPSVAKHSVRAAAKGSPRKSSTPVKKPWR